MNKQMDEQQKEVKEMFLEFLQQEYQKNYGLQSCKPRFSKFGFDSLIVKGVFLSTPMIRDLIDSTTLRFFISDCGMVIQKK